MNFFSLVLVFFALFFVPNMAWSEFLINITPDVGSNQIYCSDRLVKSCYAKFSDLSRVLSEIKRADLLGEDEVRVHILPGKYRIEKPISVKWSSKKQGGKLVFFGDEGEKSIISGAAIISPVASSVAGMVEFDFSGSEHFLGEFNVRGYDFKVSPHPGELFKNDKKLTLARQPRSGYINIYPNPRLGGGGFSVDAKTELGFSDADDEVFVFAYWRFNWADQTVLVHYDHNGGVAKQPLTFPISDSARGAIYNRASDVSDEGDWVYNRAKRKIFVKSSASSVRDVFEISVSESAFLINDSDSVFFENLFFEKFRGDVFVVNRSKRVVIKNSVFSNFGNRALVVASSEESGLANSVVSEGGEGGVVLEGGDRSLLKSANNFVENSSFYDLNSYAYSYRAAIKVLGVGQRVSGNVIHGLPHSAITFYGNDHLISNNYIYDVVLDTDDAGAIYTGHDFSSRGTTISNNYIYNIGGEGRRGVRGVYLDDQASGIVVANNYFSNIEDCVFLGGGRSNSIIGNKFHNCSKGVFVDARGKTWQRDKLFSKSGGFLSKLKAVPYTSDIWIAKYPDLKNLLVDGYGEPKYNIINDNLFCGSAAVFDPGVKDYLTISGNVFFEKNNCQ